MEENKELNEEELNKTTPVDECGSMPTRPGSTNPGDWVCQKGSWVWIENIGG